MNAIHKLISVGVFLTLIITSCAPATDTIKDEPKPEATSATIVTATEVPILIEVTATQNTTQNNLFGNHIVDGSIDLQNAFMLDIPIEGSPLWLVSAIWDNSILFVAVIEDGTTQAFKITERTYEPVQISPSRLPAGMPPLLVIADGKIQLITPPVDASPLTNPILVNNKLAYIANNGDLALNNKNSHSRLQINALPDARILIDENNRLLILAQPTTRYDHGVLGDKLEASVITLVETEPELRVLETITIEEPNVIEGISPIWADIDNDRMRDIIVTVSNSQSGSQIVAFREDGTLLAESPAIGNGYRWRHQIAVSAFGTEESQLLVSIRTPHIGGIVEFFQFKNGKLELMKEISGFSSHSIGSRNLDSAIVGDFNNDGVNELLAPDQSHTNLEIISFDGVIATLTLNGILTSNLSATTIDGKIIVGAGTEKNLRIWIP